MAVRSSVPAGAIPPLTTEPIPLSTIVTAYIMAKAFKSEAGLMRSFCQPAFGIPRTTSQKASRKNRFGI